MKNLIFFILTTLMINCNSPKKESSLNLNGHWHLFNTSMDNDKIFYTLDIKDDTIGYFHGVNVFNFNEKLAPQRNIFPETQKAIFWEDGMYERFNYNLRNDTLFLMNEHFQKLEYYAIKPSVIDPIREYFSINQTELFPAGIDQSDSIAHKKEGIIYAEVIFGKNKYTGKPELEIERGLLSKNLSLSLLIEKFKVKIPSTKKLGAILNVDQNVDKKEIDKLVEVLKSHNFEDFLERKITKDGELVLISTY